MKASVKEDIRPGSQVKGVTLKTSSLSLFVVDWDTILSCHHVGNCYRDRSSISISSLSAFQCRGNGLEWINLICGSRLATKSKLANSTVEEND
jgi:hypothetical protein